MLENNLMVDSLNEKLKDYFFALPESLCDFLLASKKNYNWMGNTCNYLGVDYNKLEEELIDFALFMGDRPVELINSGGYNPFLLVFKSSRRITEFFYNIGDEKINNIISKGKSAYKLPAQQMIATISIASEERTQRAKSVLRRRLKDSGGEATILVHPFFSMPFDDGCAESNEYFKNISDILQTKNQVIIYEETCWISKAKTIADKLNPDCYFVLTDFANPNPLEGWSDNIEHLKELGVEKIKIGGRKLIHLGGEYSGCVFGLYTNLEPFERKIINSAVYPHIFGEN